MSIVKSILFTILRGWLAGLFTLIVTFFLGHHWVTQDQAHQVTVWFSGWADVAVNALIGTIIATVPPILWGIYSRLRDWLRIKIALLMPKGTTVAELKKKVDSASVAAVITTDASKVVPQ